MKTLTTVRSRPLYIGLIIFIFVSCESFDDTPTPVMTRYNFAPEVLENIFTPDIPKEIRNVDNFLDRIKQEGMVIYEGSAPPKIFDYNDNERAGRKFNIKNNCIYDRNNSDNVGFVYGKYEESILTPVDPVNQTNFVADISYSSVLDPAFPQFRADLDSGSGRGYVSGSGENFTIFYKVTNGNFDGIPYQAIWIISGTYNLRSEGSGLTNVTKCMIMLQKGEDPDDKVANRGTVRIFKDEFPEWIPYWMSN